MKEKSKIPLRRIEEILRKSGSPLAQQVQSVNDISELPHKTRQLIAEELADELCRAGLNPDSEPNEYGLEIEDLIDSCDLGKN